METLKSPTLGEEIRRIRTRLRKSQEEFADLLGSQRNSISRYEANKVEPGLSILWRLHGIAEPDEKETFAAEIRKQVGTAILGREATVEATIDELRPIIQEMVQAEQLRSLNPGKREDVAGLLWATFQLATSEDRIDESLIEILRLWVSHRKSKGAKKVFREAAALLRERFKLASEDNHDT